MPGNQRRKLSKAERLRLGQAVRELREGLNWEKADLAVRSTLGESTIRQIENATGKSTPRPATLEILSRALEQPPGHLAGVLDGIQQNNEPAQVVDNVALLSSVVEVQQCLDRLDVEMRRRLDKIDTDMRESQALAEVVYLERHQILKQELGNIGAMLKRLSPPDIIYRQDSGTGNQA